jgi:superoxide dismutase, Cu-Zn family
MIVHSQSAFPFISDKEANMRQAYLLGGLTLFLAICCTAGNAEALVSGSAIISGCTDPAVSGFGLLVEAPSSEGVKLVTVTLAVSGLPDGKHAVHIHETGNCTPCSAANGHFDPGPASNSSPDGNHPYHSGDLINLEVRNGFGVLNTVTSRVTLSPGPLSVFDGDGSAFIIHVNPDTYCPDGPVAGCAGGARAACGIIRAH